MSSDLNLFFARGIRKEVAFYRKLLAFKCLSDVRMSLDGLLNALDELAVFLDECDHLYYRPESRWNGWGSWAKTVRDFKSALVDAHEADDNIERHQILVEIKWSVVTPKKGLRDNIIVDERKRVTVEEMNEPLTQDEEQANRRMNELVVEVERHLLPLIKEYPVLHLR